MLANRKLFQKLLILVSVPLFFELGFVGLLAYLEGQAHQKAEANAHSKEVIYEVNHFIRLLYDIASTVVLVEAFGGSEASTKPTIAEKQAEATLNHLKILTANSPEEQAAVDRLRILLGRLQKVVHDPEGQLHNLANTGAGRLQLFSMVSSTVVTGGEIIEAEGKKRSQLGPQIEQTRGLLIASLWIGLTLSVLLALMLTTLMQREIVQRLDTILGNIRRFEERAPLQSLVPGGDEIAVLDRFFHQMADRVAQAEERQKELQRLKQEFLAMVSHDLKTPISSVKMFLSMLADRDIFNLKSEDEIATSASTLENEMSRLLRMIADLLDLEKLEEASIPLELESHSTSDLVQKSIASVKGLSDDRDIEILFTPDGTRVRANSDQIVRVFINLLSNAIKFSPTCGTITVNIEQAKAFVKVSVTDQGRGIPPEMTEKIFDRFRQVDQTDATLKGGSGLGLAICKAIVQRHGGQIGVDSEPEKGSTFWLTLPSA